MILRELFTEAFDGFSDSVRRVEDSSDTKMWEFTAGENSYTIMFGLIPHDDQMPESRSGKWWGIAFAMHDPSTQQHTFDMTGAGNAHTVLATMLKTWSDFANQNPNDGFYFSSDNEHGTSRTRVYTRMAERFRKNGYTVDTERLGSDTEFYVYRPTVTEARRNPEQNPKTSVNSAILKRLDATNDMLAGVPNMFISFTSIEKLGVNPQSTDRTPIGIYSYPAEYALETMGEYFDPEQVMPYAGNRPWVNIFRMKGNFLSLKMTSSIERQLYKLLASVIERTVPPEHVDFALHELDTHIEDAPTNARQPEHPGGRFWYVTYQLSRTLSDSRFSSSKWKNRFPVNWNLLFRVMSIDGLVDPGLSIIHDNEPNQAVAFSGVAIDDNQRVANKYSPQRLEHQQLIRSLNKGDDQEVFEILKNKPSWLSKIETPSKELLLKLIDYSSNHAFNIAMMHSDDVEIQEKLVSQNARSIQWINNPDESVQKIAVSERPEYIQYIYNPTKRVQLMAVKAEPDVFKRIKDPDPVVVNYYNQLTGA